MDGSIAPLSPKKGSFYSEEDEEEKTFVTSNRFSVEKYYTFFKERQRKKK